MTELGWKQLVAGWPWYRGEGSFPCQPDSEFMPALRVLRKPYGCWDMVPLEENDPFGWPVTEYEEAITIRPGLRDIAHVIMEQLRKAAAGTEDHGIAEYKLRHNPYWCPNLADTPALRREPFVLLLPLALSLAQDDKARIRWTVYGGSEQGPARPFWESFFTAPGVEMHPEDALNFFRTLLHGAFGEKRDDLFTAGFRILPQCGGLPNRFPGEEVLPSWADAFLWAPGQPLKGVNYLLTFRPYRLLPLNVRRAYRAGDLHLLPFPGSLFFWGVPAYFRLQRELPFATQIPLLHSLEREAGIHGLRVPQSGWLHEPDEDEPGPSEPRGPIRTKYKRTNRHDRVHRREDELVGAEEDKIAHVLFSTNPDDLGLYDKPMARNAELWTRDFKLLLDGPRANLHQITKAALQLKDGGLFGYRFQVPAMRVGPHQVYWHRPLVAYRSRAGRINTVPAGPTGYLTAYAEDKPDLRRPIELWPRILRRELHADNIELFFGIQEDEPNKTVFNVRKIIHAWETLGRQPLTASFARSLITLAKRKSLEGWLRSLPGLAKNEERGREFVGKLRGLIDFDPKADEPPAALTFDRTANREFELAYWQTIAGLSTGGFVNKNNADCVLDGPTMAALKHTRRDLEPLGDYLLGRHAKAVADAGLTGEALVGELPFQWQTDLAFPWMGGWKDNQDGRTYERNLLVMIPGRDRSQAVIFADHYDTAYMSDHFEREQGGTGARLATPGADDNCSATATLLLAAPIFLEMSKRGELACDVWLLHLTGEEYPAEGLGTCRMCRELLEGTLKLHLPNGGWRDLSKVQVRGLYVMDMIAHNCAQGRDVFQISPGYSKESLWLAYQAHLANHAWNRSIAAWNRGRRGAGRGQRVRSGTEPPKLALHPDLLGEVRLPYDAHSTLYNTDGQMYSDIGVPVVLFMENYDIDRTGYHDSQDTMANINLDYGAALAAIAIEATARAATQERPG
ncbi:MAG: M28 family peptidase [Gemmataceae bacterium]